MLRTQDGRDRGIKAHESGVGYKLGQVCEVIQQVTELLVKEGLSKGVAFKLRPKGQG